MFDKLRESFLLQICPNRDISELRRSIFDDDLMAQWTSMLTDREQETLVRLVNEHLEEYESCVASTGPPAGFEELAWPCVLSIAPMRRNYHCTTNVRALP